MIPTPFYLNKDKKPVTESRTLQILRSSESLEFHSSLEAYRPTPLLELKELAQKLEVGNIYLKDESFRFGLNAFKGLGASYAIHKILKRNPEITTFCTATDGNHGRAVAWSAKLFEKQSRIFVPRDTTRHRIEAIRKEGAIVEQLEANYDETCKYAAEVSQKEGWQLVQDTSWEGYEEIPAEIMAGYMTHFRELENSVHQLPKAEIDVVFLQAGVGSWPAAAAWYYQNRYGENRPKLVIVEPTESSGILESLRAGHRTSPRGNNNTIMAGLNCGIPSLNAWEILEGTADAAMEIEDSHAKEAMRILYHSEGDGAKIISGESGVGGFAGFYALMKDQRFQELKKALQINEQSKILVYNTEGATDPENYERIISESQDFSQQ